MILPKQHLWSLLIITALLSTLSACNTKTSPNTMSLQQLNQSSWVLSTPLSANALYPITLSFKQGRISGLNRCESYSGHYTAHPDGTLAFGQINTNSARCHSQDQVIDKTYTTRLNQVRMYALLPGQLQLLDSTRKPLLSFRPNSARAQ